MASGASTGQDGTVRVARARGLGVFAVLLTVLFLGIGARLVQLQVLLHREKAQEVVDILYSPVTERDHRGSIVDARGIPLAVSVATRSCALDPKILLESEGAKPEKLISTLATLLELTPADIDRITKGVEKRRVPKANPDAEPQPIRFVWVKRRVGEEQYKALATAMEAAKREASDAWKNRRRWLRLAGRRKVARDPEGEKACREYAEGWRRVALDAEGRFAGVMFPPEYERVYPQRELASHILGFSDIDGNGLEGVEKTCDSLLQGVAVKRLVARDARSRALSTMVEDGRSSDGMTVELTIDSVVQAIVEEELQTTVDRYKQEFPEVHAHAVVMDPWTGDILAIANYPTFDPNHPGTMPETGERVDPRTRRNDAVAAIQEPGSTFKPLLIAAALEEKVASLDDMIECATFSMNGGRRTIKDIHPYGRMTRVMARLKSTNPRLVRIGQRLGAEKMRQYVKAYGFGEKTGSLLPGEVRGRVTTAEKWNDWTMGSVPMGYEINVTTLQMATAYSAIANGGQLPRPNIVRRVFDATGGLALETQPHMRRRVISEETAATMRRVLRKVVTDGTGRRANIKEYELGGKTGTANMIANADEKKANPKIGYSNKRHTANFVALVPWDKPRAIVCVSIRETGKYGGEAASPPGAAIARRLMGYWGVPTANGTPIMADILPRKVFEPAPVPVIYTIGAPDDDNRMSEEIDPRWMEEMIDDSEAFG
ncbi:MAG: penicillin-binding protein 2 [Planctomycetes bacterium]|nr:penicillin-binding protein 2 [Planctomycetota bacterium]